jgi:hypothetical protein
MAETYKRRQATQQQDDAEVRAEAEATLQDTKKKLIAAERNIEALKGFEHQLAAKIREANIFDRTLNNIRIFGLPEQAQQQLLSLLPVRQGEILTRDSFKLIDAAIHDFDSHLQVRLVPTENNGVELQIIPPGLRK